MNSAVRSLGDGVVRPIVMVGSGGTSIALLDDIVHAPAPVDEPEAMRKLLSLKSAPLLSGFNGAGPIDLAPAAKLIAALSRAAQTLRGQVAEIALNSVILHAGRSGLTVADAAIALKV